MSGSRIRKGWKPISAFKEGYEATVAMLLRRIDQFLRDPFEVGFEKLQPGKRVAEIRVVIASRKRIPSSPARSGALTILPTPVSVTAPVPGKSGI